MSFDHNFEVTLAIEFDGEKETRVVEKEARNRMAATHLAVDEALKELVDRSGSEGGSHIGFVRLVGTARLASAVAA